MKLMMLGIISGIVTGLGMGGRKYFNNIINGIYGGESTYCTSH